MLPQNKIIFNYLAKQARSPFLNEALREQFLARCQENRSITKIEKETDHTCTFALPYDKKTNTVFLGHHKKANSWIPVEEAYKRSGHPQFIDKLKQLPTFVKAHF